MLGDTFSEQDENVPVSEDMDFVPIEKNSQVIQNISCLHMYV